MKPTTVCELCDDPGSIHDSPEVERVFSNVRRFSHESFTVWRCKNCASLHSKEAVDLPKYYADYWMTRLKAGYFLNRFYGTRLRRLRAHGVSPGHKILEYGCGEGQFINFLKHRGFMNVLGYDPYSFKYAAPDVLNQSYYDVVASYDVIEHVDDPKQLMSQLSSLLLPGGLLIIGTPNAAEICLKPDPPIEKLHQPYHRHILTEVVLKQIGTRAHLQPIKTYHRRELDTLWPGVNSQFIFSYQEAAGNYAEVLLEKPKLRLVLTSPALILKFFAGYFVRFRGDMVVFFRKDYTE